MGEMVMTVWAIVGLVTVVVVGHSFDRRHAIASVEIWTRVLREHLDIPEGERGPIWQVEMAMVAQTLLEMMSKIKDQAVLQEAHYQLLRAALPPRWQASGGSQV